MWETLSGKTDAGAPVGTPTRQPLALYMRVTRDHTFPPRKLRNTAASARGVLKANWLHKHKDVLPAVVVMVFLFETYDPDWRDRDGQVINEILAQRYIPGLALSPARPRADTTAAGRHDDCAGARCRTVGSASSFA